MKALSGYAEWFYLIAKGWKDIENRTWPLTRAFKKSQLPVRVYLHASKGSALASDIKFIESQLFPGQLQEFRQVNWDLYRGTLMGEATITSQEKFYPMLRASKWSPWFFGPYGFWLEAGVLYEKPIPYRGQLGFFDVVLSVEVK